MVRKEYMYNSRFREFVDRYCVEHGCTVDEALSRDEVKRAFWHYTEV